MSIQRGLVLVALMTWSWGCEEKKVEPEPAISIKDAAMDATLGMPDQKTSMDSKDSNGVMPRTSMIAMPKGEVKVVALEHGSFYLVGGPGMLIAVDPTMGALETDSESARAKADLILLTDIHGDHLDPEAVAKIRGDKTIVIAPQAVVDKAGEELGEVMIMANGDEQSLMDGALGVRAMPMYNLERKPKGRDEPFHVKGRGNGYVISLSGGTIYISGDTECTPEMKALEGITAAFVTMNLPYTMPVEEAAECVKAFKPSALYPFHYRGQDPGKLATLIGADAGVDVRLLEWYPGAKDDEGK